MADDELARRIDDVVLQGQVPTAGVGVEGAHRREGLAEELDHGLSPVAGGRESPVHLRLASALTADLRQSAEVSASRRKLLGTEFGAG